jgi:hypothetical protein
VTEPKVNRIDPERQDEDSYEFALNIWGYMDSTLGLVYALAGKAYATVGDDDELLQLLRGLAGTDYVTAPRMMLPERFHIVHPDGTRHGLAHPAEFHQDVGAPFREIFDAIETSLPPLPHFSESGHTVTPQKLGPSPYYLWTLLHEDEIGRIRPIISAADRRWLRGQELTHGRAWP